MTREELLATLRSLHDELASADTVDAQTREAFARVAADIERLTNPNEPTTAADAQASQEGLSGFVQAFEAEHPKLAASIGRVADALQNLGI